MNDETDKINGMLEIAISEQLKRINQNNRDSVQLQTRLQQLFNMKDCNHEWIAVGGLIVTQTECKHCKMIYPQ